jgi:exonuclease III
VEVDWPGFATHGVYLSPASSSERTHQLDALREVVCSSGARHLVFGDFNLAPEDRDGRYGGAPSLFTHSSERAAFRKLLADGGLTDLYRHQHLDGEDFTFEKTHRGKRLQFRCDLALVSRDLADTSSLVHLHEPRTHGLSDHSAVLLDLAIQPGKRNI